MTAKPFNPHVDPFFSLKNRLLRALWGVVCMLLFQPSPIIFHAWRRFLLRIFGAKVGKGVRVYPKVKIWAPWNLVLGDYVGVGNGANLYNMALIEIGEYSVISQEAYLCAGSHDISTIDFTLIREPIIVGKRCWVCAQTFIGLGVNIPDGCVIGARAVLVKSVKQPWSVWAGNPAKCINVRVLSDD